MMAMKPQDFAAVYDKFQASVSRYDCGRFCAPLNNGEPVCCTTHHAIPVVDRQEFKLLQTRSDLWRRFKPKDAEGRKIVSELDRSCCAVECKGARHCERDNRSLACRAFPFYAYMTKEGEFVGLASYWIYEDRCWLISNMQVVEREFIREFVAAYEYVFERDPGEYDTMKWYSGIHRRVFSRRKQPIPLVGREGGFFQVMPYTGKIEPVTANALPHFGPYVSDRAYREAVAEAGGNDYLPEASREAAE